jgi:RNA polymerase sigma-70 factor (ECF subfamily)
MLMFMPRSPHDRAASTGAASLAQRVARGDRLALEEIYRREAAAVYRYALALSGNPAWAADAVQEAFVVFSQRAEAFDEQRATLGAYLAGVARHHLLAQWRQLRAETPSEEPGEEPGASLAEGDVAAASPETLMVRAQGTEALWAALRRLPLPMREVLVLVDLQERPYADAAQIAGIELNTLRTRLHRARLRLAALLRETGSVQLEDFA